MFTEVDGKVRVRDQSEHPDVHTNDRTLELTGSGGWAVGMQDTGLNTHTCTHTCAHATLTQFPWMGQ
jgi:hypothetical protein